MSCLEYRRLLLAGEGESGPMKAHRLQCLSCAELARAQSGFEAALREALEVPVPSGFEARVTSAAAAHRRRFLAAAALGVLALGGGTLAWLVRRDDPLAMACIDFVMKEEAKSLMMGPMPRQEAQAALAPMLPLEKLESMGQVRHVGPCPFNGVMAYHVVIEVPQGKLTLLVMPKGLDTPQRAAEHGMHALVVALERGSVGVIGADAEVVESFSGALAGWG